MPKLRENSIVIEVWEENDQFYAELWENGITFLDHLKQKSLHKLMKKIKTRVCAKLQLP